MQLLTSLFNQKFLKHKTSWQDSFSRTQTANKNVFSSRVEINRLYKIEIACCAFYENNSSTSDNEAEGGTTNSYKYNINNVIVFPLTSTLVSLGK